MLNQFVTLKNYTINVNNITYIEMRHDLNQIAICFNNDSELRLHSSYGNKLRQYLELEIEECKIGK